jgi:hypothetical protein
VSEPVVVINSLSGISYGVAIAGEVEGKVSLCATLRPDAVWPG